MATTPTLQKNKLKQLPVSCIVTWVSVGANARLIAGTEFKMTSYEGDTHV